MAVVMPTVLYLGGMSRSGSTLAERLIGLLPGVYPVGELVHLWRRGLVLDEHCGCAEPFSGCPLWQKVGDVAFGGWDQVDVARLEQLRYAVDRTRFIPLLATSARLPPGYRRLLAEYLSYYQRLYAAIGEVTGCRVVIDSSKHASLAFCLARSPVSLRVVHVVRDPRAVAHSWTRLVSRDAVAGSLMRTQRPARTVWEWDLQNAAMDLLALTRWPVLRIRYEDLVDDPAAVLGQITAFAGLPATAADLDFLNHDGGRWWAELGVSHAVSGNRLRFATGPVDIRRDDTWRRALPPHTRAGVSALTIPWLARYGYLRDGGPAGRSTTGPGR